MIYVNVGFLIFVNTFKISKYIFKDLFKNVTKKYIFLILGIL